MKTVTTILAVGFAILAIILYFVSIQEVNTGYGSIQVANIQATIFAAACAVMSCVNVVGLLIMKHIDWMNDNIYNGFEDMKKRIENK